MTGPNDLLLDAGWFGGRHSDAHAVLSDLMSAGFDTHVAGTRFVEEYDRLSFVSRRGGDLYFHAARAARRHFPDWLQRFSQIENELFMPIGGLGPCLLAIGEGGRFVLIFDASYGFVGTSVHQCLQAICLSDFKGTLLNQTMQAD